VRLQSESPDSRPGKILRGQWRLRSLRCACRLQLSHWPQGFRLFLHCLEAEFMQSPLSHCSQLFFRLCVPQKLQDPNLFAGCPQDTVIYLLGVLRTLSAGAFSEGGVLVRRPARCRKFLGASRSGRRTPYGESRVPCWCAFLQNIIIILLYYYIIILLYYYIIILYYYYIIIL
jgi:hypothetical protein